MQTPYKVLCVCLKEHSQLEWTYIVDNSNTSCLYSQWLNSMIYWLINNCTDWAQIGVTSFGHQFELHNIIYQIQPCSIVNIWQNVALQLMDVQSVRKNTRFSPNKSYRKFYHSVQDGRIVIDPERFVHDFNLFVCKNRNKGVCALRGYFGPL